MPGQAKDPKDVLGLHSMAHNHSNTQKCSLYGFMEQTQGREAGWCSSHTGCYDSFMNVRIVSGFHLCLFLFQGRQGRRD
jgi:hypothetical protein